MMQTWIEQPGYPVLSAKREGDQLILSQKRFSYQPNSSGQIWQIPVSISVLKGNSEWQHLDVLMDTESKSVALPNENTVYKINTRQTGFYRVKYLNPQDMDKLGNEIRQKTLPSEDRWGLENDLYAQVKSSDESLDTYLDFLKYYENETNFLPLSSIGDNLLNSYLLSGSENRQKIVQTGISLIEKLLLTIGYTPQPHEDHTCGSLRDQYIWQGVVFGSEQVASFANAEFNKLIENIPVHPDMIKSIMQAGALSGNQSTFDWFIQRFEKSASEHDRTNILSAMGCFTDDEIISKVQDYTLRHVPARNQSIPIASLAMNPAVMAGLWDWYKSEKELIAEFHPIIHERVFSVIVPVSDKAEPDAVRIFLKQNMIKINPDVVELTLERLLINQILKKNFSK
jgi:aminopeptidase N